MSDLDDVPDIVVESLRRAYADTPENEDEYDHGERCLSYLMPRWVSPMQAAELAEYIGGYNCFTPDRFRALMERVDEEDDTSVVALGREGSPVAYIETHFPESVIEAIESAGEDDGVVEPDDHPFGDGRPDELWEVPPDEVGSVRQYADRDEDYMEAHYSCSHDTPPVPDDEIADVATEGGRKYIRAWWD
jgi:hypothetical protein